MNNEMSIAMLSARVDYRGGTPRRQPVHQHECKDRRIIKVDKMLKNPEIAQRSGPEMTNDAELASARSGNGP